MWGFVGLLAVVWFFCGGVGVLRRWASRARLRGMEMCAFNWSAGVVADSYVGWGALVGPAGRLCSGFHPGRVGW